MKFKRSMNLFSPPCSSISFAVKMRLRGNTVEEQVQWVLTYVQGGSADVWKENIMEELESGEVEYESVEEFLTTLKRNLGEGKKNR